LEVIVRKFVADIQQAAYQQGWQDAIAAVANVARNQASGRTSGSSIPDITLLQVNSCPEGLELS
jgi:hypothetical protein